MDVFLLGAGASAPLGLPVTRGFLSDFSPEGDAAHIFRAILQHSRSGAETLDIELVFSLLDDLCELENSFLVYLFNSRTLSPIARRGNEILVCSEAINSGAKAAKELLLQVKSFVLRKITGFSSEDAFRLFFPVFKPAISPEKPLLIFTTNYDLTVEDAFTGKSLRLLREWIDLGLKRLYFGFELLDRGAIFNFRREEAFRPGTASILKLHGSINWRPHDGLIVLGGKDVPADPDAVFLIYPGYKSVPDREPFVSLHLAFLEVLSRAKRLIAVGFAFRDLYINSILHHVLALNEDLRVYALAPEFPEDSHFPALKEAFPDRVHHLQGKLGFPGDEEALDLWTEIQHLEEQGSSSPSEELQAQS